MQRNLLGSPREVYLAIFDNPDNVKQLSKAIQSQLELSKEQLEIYSGLEDSQVFNVEEKANFSTTLRNIFAADEVSRENEFKKALEEGKFVVQVNVDESDDEKRRAVEDLLNANDAQTIHYFGKLNFEDVATQ